MEDTDGNVGPDESETTTTSTAETATPTETTPASTRTPGIGLMVHYVMDDGHFPGEHRPAVVVKVGADEDHLERVQVQVFTDNTNDYNHTQAGSAGLLWRTDVRYDDAMSPNSWHWPEA